MVSTILHLLTIPLASLGVWMTYSSWKGKGFKNEISKNLFLFFLFYTLHNVLLSIPMLLEMSTTVLAVSYVVAIVFLFFALFPVIIIEALMAGATKGKTHLLMGFLIAVAGIVTILQIVQLPTPYIESGVVFWDANLPISLLVGTFVFFVGMHIVFIMVPHWPENITLKQKIKAIIFVSGSSMLALAGLMYYPSHHLAQTIAAAVIGYIGLIALLVSLFLRREKELKIL